MARALQREDQTFEVAETDLGLPDGDPDTVYVLRPITTGAYAGFMKRQTSMGKLVEDALDYCLVDWRGIVFNGAPVSCTRDMKLRLPFDVAKVIVDRAGLGKVQAAEADRQESFRTPA